MEISIAKVSPKQKAEFVFISVKNEKNDMIEVNEAFELVIIVIDDEVDD